MSDTPRHFFDLTPDQLQTIVTGTGLPRFRAKQISQWVYEKGVTSFDDMANISKADRAKLADHLYISSCDVVQHQTASDGVEKLLVQWHRSGQPPERPPEHAPEQPPEQPAEQPTEQDLSLAVLDTSLQTECVMIPSASEARERKTACISSQVGCAVGCKFCASGIGGLDGDLTAGQIVEQVWRLGLLPGVGRISNVVFMGMGEPLSNFNQVAQAVRTLTADWGLNISARKITVSTVGLPAQIRRLAELELPITLAISLHAPNDEIRRALIPWADYVSIDDLIAAGQHYFAATGREITLEYILLRRVNDRPEHAHELATVAKKLRCNVNLIRYNQVKDLPYKRPLTDDVHAFQDILRRSGVNVHIRASRGRDIAAACGQLRHETGSVA